jgi:AsmA protein
MKHFLKMAGIAIGIFVLFIIVAVSCLVLFVNPNRFKPIIAAQVMKYTGRQLIIDGDLSWAVFPYAGIKVGHMVLNNPAEFSQKTFAEINRAIVSVDVLPLLKSRIESSGIIVEGMKLNLITLANGHNNWTFQTAISPQNAANENIKEQDTLKKASVAIAISGITVSNAEINWINEQTKQNSSIKNFSLHAKHINLITPFPLSIAFDFVNNNPVMSGHSELTGRIALNLAEQIFSFRHLDMTTSLRRGDLRFKTMTSGDVIADLKQQTVQWSGFKGVASNLVMTGNVKIVGLDKNPHATGKLKIQPFDMKQWLQDIGNNVPNVQALKGVSGDIDFAADSNAVSVQGQLKLNEMQVNKVKITNVVVPLNYQNKIANLAPVTADLYQGTLQAQITANLTKSIPQMAVQGKLTNVQTGLLLQDLGGTNQKLKFSGAGNVDLQMTTQGSDSNTIVKNLNGQGLFSVKDGVLQGIDIAYLLNMASRLSSSKISNASNSNQTAFNTMTGNVLIRDGVISNNDLLMDSAAFTTKGNGNINLVAQRIDYQLQTSIKQVDQNQKDNLFNLYGIAIPIVITGKLNDPNIRLDTVELAKEIAQQQLRKATGNVEEEIKKNIPQAEKLLQNLLGH